MQTDPNGNRGLLWLIGALVLTMIFLADPDHTKYVVIPIAVLALSAILFVPEIRQLCFADISLLIDEFAGTGKSAGTSATQSAPVLVPSPVSRYWGEMRVYTIMVPTTTELKPDQAVLLMSKLIALGSFFLRIVGTEKEIVWQFVDTNPTTLSPDSVIAAFKGAFAEAEITDPSPLVVAHYTEPYWRIVDYYFYTEAFPRPSLRVEAIKKTDPLITIVNAMSNLQKGERVEYCVAVCLVAGEAVFQAGIEQMTLGVGQKFALDMISVVFNTDSKIPEPTWGSIWKHRSPLYDPPIMRAGEAKLLDKPHVVCYVAVEASSLSKERLENFDFSTVFSSQFSSEYQTIKDIRSPSVHITNQRQAEQNSAVEFTLRDMVEARSNPFARATCILTLSEMAALWHLPHTGMTVSEILWLKGKRVAAPVEFRGRRLGVLLGANKPTKAEIYQPSTERTVHTLIIGKTGTGKTSFMQALVEQDIRAGRGVAVIDPMGSMVKRILQHGIPTAREGDVVVLDIGFQFDNTGLFYPPPLNPLAKLNGQNARKGAGDFAAVLTKLYDDTSQTRWMQTIQTALELLTAEDQATLYDLWKVMNEKSYQTELLSRFNDFNMTQRWQRLERSGGFSETSIQSALWRLDQFLGVEIARTCTCHPNELDFFSLVKENKIILVSVHADEGIVPKSVQNVIGALILSQIQLALQAHAVADPKTCPFIMYVDEVQDFVTSSLDELARQARQNGLGLVVATQDTSTIAPTTLRALKSNLGTLVAFECNAEDAKNAIDMMPNFTVSDLMNMGRYKAVVSMRSEDGLSRAAFNIDPVHGADNSTDPKIIARERLLRDRSVATHTPMSYDEVNAWLTARYNPPTPPNASKQDNNNDYGNPLT